MGISSDHPTALSAMAIEAVNISKVFQHFQVLKAVSFAIRPGECFTLFGPNGCGKTTLLKMMATLVRPSSGQFSIMGHDGVKEKGRVRSDLFYMGHGSCLYDDLSVMENIFFACALRGVYPSNREAKIALDRVGMGAFAHLQSRVLSAGMKKRVVIAKVILIRPTVLLLDELSASLDEQGVEMAHSLIWEFKKEGSAILMSAHNPTKRAEISDRAGILKGGVLHELSPSVL